MSKRAIILAGGKGTRLKPYTIAIPKPLVPVGETPVLEIIIRQLKKSGFDHITITVNHMAEIVKAFFGNGAKWDVQIDYTVEEKPLSTMGPLTLIRDLPEKFLVMNGDVLTDLNFSDFYANHILYKSKFTIASFRRNDKIDYGVLTSDKQNKLINFEEKPSYEFLVSMGIYMISREVIDYIPKDTFYGFDHLMKLMIEKSDFPSIFEYKGYWLDIGRPDDYEKAVKEIDGMSFLK